jgi:hypothetical protein
VIVSTTVKGEGYSQKVVANALVENKKTSIITIIKCVVFIANLLLEKNI